MKKTTPILSLSLALLLIFGVGAINAQAQQVQRNVSPSFGENNPPTLSERASAPNLMDFGVSSLPAGHNDAFSGLNGGDTLPPLSRVIADNNLCPLADQCAYTLTGYDSYGDSWNNGHVTISQNGTQVGDYAVPDDGGYGHGNVPHVWAVMLCPNLPTTVTFTAGSYASEVSYSFVNPAGVVVAHKDAGSSSNITETFTAVCPNCLAPTPSISGTTDNQADINWAADPAVPEYDIQWKASSVSSWTGSGVQQALGVASSPYTITGLSAQTTYNVRIRSVCTPGGNIENEDFSTWTTVNLTTACGAVDISTMGTSSSTGSLPWNDNFSLYTDAYQANNQWVAKGQSLPDCWTRVEASNVSGCPIYVHGSNNRLDFCGGFTSGFRAATMPALPDEVNLAQVKIKFWYQQNASGTYMKVAMTSNPGSTNINDYDVIGQTYANNADNTFSLENYTGEGRYISFITQNGGGLLDNLNVWIDYSVIVTPVDQSILWSQSLNAIEGDSPIALTATATSGLAVTYTSSNPAVATVSGNTLTIVGAGTSAIVASQAGSNQYNPAAGVVKTLTVLPLTPDIVYVTPNGGGAHNGSSWLNAYAGLANALLAAGTPGSEITEIRVAAGTYYPAFKAGDGASDRDKAFVLVNGVKIYGGFAGNETGLNRSLSSAATILSGDIDDVSGISANDAYHVVIAAGITDATTLLDGFTIVGGNANDASNIDVSSNTINRNYGGGIYSNNSNATFSHISVSGNAATNGGGIYSNDGSTNFINLSVVGNTASNGGGIYNADGTDNFTNVTVGGNTATTDGGGIYAADGAIALNNSIVASNTAATAPDIFVATAATVDASHSLIGNATQTGTGSVTIGTGNITNTAPVFTNAGSGNCSLQGTSPAINAGNDDLYTGTLATDKDVAGNPRLSGASIDMGAYEYLGVVIGTSSLPNGTVDAAYDTQLAATDGTITWSVESGSTLPAGLSLSATGALSGTPTAAGTFSFTVVATNTAGGIASTPLSLTIAPTSQTITWTQTLSATYGDSPITLTAAATSGLAVTYTSNNPTVATVSGNTLTILNAGTTTITASQAGNANYNAAAVPIVLTVNQKPVTITGLTAIDKVYDGSNTATILGTAALTGVLGGDNLTITNGTATFNNKNAGNNKAVTFSGYALGGTSVSNYTLAAQPASTTANITPKPASITGLVANNKEYNGSTSTTVTSTAAVITGKVAGDNLNIVTGIGRFNNKNVGNNKPVTFSGFALSGSDLGNYAFAGQPASTTANITVKTLTINLSNATVAPKAYDGTATATVTGVTLDGVAANEPLLTPTDFSWTATFDNANAGAGKTVTVTVSLQATALTGNYQLPATTATIANQSIARAPQTITFAPATSLQIANGAYALSASSTSGIAVQFRLRTGDATFATLNGSTLTPLQAGQVEVTAYIANDPNYADAAVARLITISGTTVGIDDIASQTLHAYPNPVKRGEKITLEYSTPANKANSIAQIYSVSGALMSTQILSGNSSTIDVPAISGMYVIRVNNEAVKIVVE